MALNLLKIEEGCLLFPADFALFNKEPRRTLSHLGKDNKKPQN